MCFHECFQRNYLLKQQQKTQLEQTQFRIVEKMCGLSVFVFMTTGLMLLMVQYILTENCTAYRASNNSIMRAQHCLYYCCGTCEDRECCEESENAIIQSVCYNNEITTVPKRFIKKINLYYF